MPPIRTTRSYSRTQDKELPPLRGMYISVSRVKPYVGNKWNCQIDLVEDCIDLCAGDPVRVSSIDVSPLKIVIDNVLEVDTRVTEEDGDDENGEAVQDYRRAGKSIAELYVIKNKDALKKLEL